MSGSKPGSGKTTVTLTPTVPRALADLYQATQRSRASLGQAPLPTISAILRDGMARALAAAGLPPSSLPPPPSPTRTSAAVAARSRKRLAEKNGPG